MIVLSVPVSMRFPNLKGMDYKMNLRKMFSIVLCALLLLSVFSVGCSPPAEDEVENGNGTTSTSDPPAVETPPLSGIDFDAAIAAFPPDTIMMKTNTLSVTWAELYVFLFRVVTDIAQYSDFGIDWSEEYEIGVSLAELVLEYSTEEAFTFMLFEYGALELGITLSESDLAEINEDIDNLIAMYGSKEELERSLRESSGFYDLSTLELLMQIEHKRGLILVDLYGEDLGEFSDEASAEFADENDFLMAKHILVAFSEHDDALEVAEDILAQLKEHVDDEDFFDIFDTMMHELSDDPGAVSFPDGYLFQPHNMVPQFSEASAELEIGEMSGLVETVHGYHIILRLPIDFDSVPIEYASGGMPPTLRQLALYNDFEALMLRWRSELTPIFSPEYNSIDLAAIFLWH